MSTRARKAPPELLAGVDLNISKVEANVIRRMVDVDFSAEDVTAWMFPDDVIATLRAAWPLIAARDRSQWTFQRLSLPIHGTQDVMVSLTLKLGHLKVCVPEQKAQNNLERYPRIGTALAAAYAEHLKFEKVRRVVRWLNANATAGAAKDLCPWLTSIVPADNPFHTATGRGYRHPQGDMSEITPIMRECSAIMAGALLAGDTSDLPKLDTFAVQFYGERDGESYVSGHFGLL